MCFGKVCFRLNCSLKINQTLSCVVASFFCDVQTEFTGIVHCEVVFLLRPYEHASRLLATRLQQLVFSRNCVFF